MTIRELVERFCVQKLASILYECLAFSDADRAETDWLTAERYVKDNPQLVDHVLRTFMFQGKTHVQITGATPVEDVSSDISYETFVQGCGRTVWDYLYQPFRKHSELPYHDPYKPHYTYIRFG